MTDANIATFPPLVVGTDPEGVKKAFRLPLAFAVGFSAKIPHGILVLPWQAIASVQVQKRGKHRIAIFRVAEGVTPDSPGVHTTIKPGVFKLLAKKGFRMGSAGIDVPMQTILDATAAFTAGRLIAR